MVDAKRLFEVKTATLINFGQLWTANFQANRNLALRSPGVSCLFDRFRSIPAVIVGAGPSLDKNINLLPQVQDKALIICVDTVLSTLESAGVKPTLVITLDPQLEIASFFTHTNTRDKTLVAPTIIHPSALSAWKGRVVFYNKFAPDIPELVNIANANPKTGYLVPGGSVLSVGLDLAFKMGANPIAFIGQDLSFPPGESAYCQGTIYGADRYDALSAEQIEDMVTDTDIFGRQVPTKKSLFITRQWMEWAFTTWKRPNPADFYNCTEGGIVTNHCHLTSLKEWVTRFPGKKMNFTWAITKALGKAKR